MPSWVRHVNSPDKYNLELPGRGTLQDKIYVGFVKNAVDAQSMGRLQVWIPELNGDPTDPSGWFIVNYCTPFGGATNVYQNTNQNNYSGTQKSYGFWFVPPDINNEVVCAFINGDPGRGIWLGCLYQQNMNSMVPGIPGQDSNATLPATEYNKNVNHTNINNPDQPLYTPLSDALVKQGLDQDTLRGVSSSGARRISPALSVNGILTPGGSQFVLDDDPSNTFIRLRTQNGAQIIINDTSGFIYLNSVDGKNWISMDAGGKIDVYAYSDISIRSQGSLNLRADQDVNIEAGQNINIKARGSAAAPLVANPLSNTPIPAQTTPGLTSVIGDGVAAAIGSKINDATVVAGPDLTSSNILTNVQSSNIKSSTNSVLSLGTSDFANNTGNAQLLTNNAIAIRSALSSTNYIWVLPYNSTAKSAIQSVASSHNDTTIDLSNYPTVNNMYPRDFGLVTNDVVAKLAPPGVTTNSNSASSNSSVSTTTSTTVGNAAPAGTNYVTIVTPFLEQVEGKENDAFWDAANQRTLVSIGYGHQIKSNEYSQGYIDTGTTGRIAVKSPVGSGSKPGCGTATDAQCTSLLSIDVVQYAAGARNMLKGSWDLLGPYQQAALTSVYYNSPATLNRLIGQGITNFIAKSDLQSAATLIANAGPAVVASRRVKESNLYLQRPDLLGKGGSGPDGTAIPGTGDSQAAPGSMIVEDANITNGYIKIESRNSMHLLSDQYMFLTSAADMHRYSAANIYDTAAQNVNRLAGGYVHESVGQDFSVGSGGNMNLFAPRVDMNGPAPALAVGAVSAQGPADLSQADVLLDSLGNIVQLLTDTIVYHLPYHEPYDDHGGRSTYGIQNSTTINKNTNLRDGEVIPNSSNPLNIVGTPRNDMPSGIYQGAGYNSSNQPIYAYQGKVSNANICTTSSLTISTPGIQFIESYENGSYLVISVGNPLVQQIGYGHNLTPTEISTNSITIDGSPVPLSQPLTQQQVGSLFNNDITAVQIWLRPIVNVAVTQTQFDMLCSLAFNIGQNNFTNSAAIAALNSGNLSKVPNLWMQHTVDGSGAVVPALVVRRRAEVTKFMLAPKNETVPIITNSTISTGTVGNVTPNY